MHGLYDREQNRSERLCLADSRPSGKGPNEEGGYWRSRRVNKLLVGDHRAFAVDERDVENAGVAGLHHLALTYMGLHVFANTRRVNDQFGIAPFTPEVIDVDARLGELGETGPGLVCGFEGYLETTAATVNVVNDVVGNDPGVVSVISTVNRLVIARNGFLDLYVGFGKSVPAGIGESV